MSFPALAILMPWKPRPWNSKVFLKDKHSYYEEKLAAIYKLVSNLAPAAILSCEGKEYRPFVPRSWRQLESLTSIMPPFSAWPSQLCCLTAG